jgi:RNA polymerase sigma factor (sigma-70 family)
MGEMNETSDAQLLRDYAARGSEAAFRELVARHTAAIYSSALRQVDSPDLAADLTQRVFTDLARKADTISAGMTAHASVLGWLFRSTRYAALNLRRDDQRRQTRERQAMEILLNNTDAPGDWEQIRPTLDEALDALGDEDREALLLRYIKNQDLRTVGATLGISDDAAQKRVSRAVERLREFFGKRGVSVGAGGLVAVISANAVQAAPVGLAVTISAAALAGTAATTSTLIAATTKTIAMTTLQKTLVTATVAVLAGAGIYEARQASQLREQVQTLQQQQAPLADQIRVLQKGFAEATNHMADLLAENSRLKSNPERNELLKLRGEVTRLRNEADQSAEKTLRAWSARMAKLQEWLKQKPEYKIPELALLDDEDWLAAVKSRSLQTERQYRWAASGLRGSAENQFASMLSDALQKYAAENGKQFPTDLNQLQPYFAAPVSEAILERWQIASGKKFPGVGDWVVTQKTVPDEAFDSRITVGLNGRSSADFLSSAYREIMMPVYQAYEAANDGQKFDDTPDYALLLPYATTPEQKAAVQKWIDKTSK